MPINSIHFSTIATLLAALTLCQPAAGQSAPFERPYHISQTHAHEGRTSLTLNIRIPLGADHTSQDIVHAARFNIGFAFDEGQSLSDWSNNRRGYELGLTAQGTGYLFVGDQHVSLMQLSAPFHADGDAGAAGSTSASNNTLLILAVLASAQLPLVAAAGREVEDNIDDCVSDIFNGTEGGCRD